MKIPRTIEDIEAYINNRVQESLHLDYKMSMAIDDSKRNEIAKDVSAFSNSDGGLVIYGIEEDQHIPVKIDNGVDHKKYSKEWLEQVLISNISPIIDGVEIIPIPLNATNSIYVVDIPKSNRAPHQERGSNRYYKRYNFKSAPMEDYEINDIRNRSYIVPPLINVELTIEHGTIIYLDIVNIGDVPAIDVRTKLPDGFTLDLYTEPPPFFQRPVKYIPPGKKFSFMYDSYQSIMNSTSKLREFNIDIEYTHPRNNMKYSDSFYFNLLDYMYTRSEESEIYELGKVLKESIKDLSNKIDQLGKYTEEISRIADPTGLSLSVTTLKNIQTLVKGKENFEKIDPRHCNYKVFKEVLGVSDEIALILYRFFSYNWGKKELREIEGLNDLLINEIKQKFLLENT